MESRSNTPIVRLSPLIFTVSGMTISDLVSPSQAARKLVSQVRAPIKLTNVARIAIHICHHHALFVNIGIRADTFASSRGDANAGWTPVERTQRQILASGILCERKRKVVEACNDQYLLKTAELKDTYRPS